MSISIYLSIYIIVYIYIHICSQRAKKLLLELTATARTTHNKLDIGRYIQRRKECRKHLPDATLNLSKARAKSVPSTPTLFCMAERSGYVVMTVMMMTALMIGTP